MNASFSLVTSLCATHSFPAPVSLADLRALHRLFWERRCSARELRGPFCDGAHHCSPLLTMDELTIASAQPFPYKMPSTGRVALIMIDWQRDFLDEGGFGHALGNDVSTLHRGLGSAAAVLTAARACGVPIIHTLETHKPDLCGALLPLANCSRLSLHGAGFSSRASRATRSSMRWRRSRASSCCTQAGQRRLLRHCAAR